MSRKINLQKDPYGNNYDIFQKASVTIKTGVTVLVGCNGIGKSTLLHNIKEELKKKKISCIIFNNLTDGGSYARNRAGFFGDINFLGTSLLSSEGENIMMNIGTVAGKIGTFIRKNPDSKELWILLDAADSGLSIDNVINIKEQLFNTILSDSRNKDRDIYIIVSANEYEMACGEQCLDICNLKYVNIDNYDLFKELILQSRKQKELRYKKGE